MRRGFKARAERWATRRRGEYGLLPADRLEPRPFLQALKVAVWEPADIPGIDPRHLRRLTETDAKGWAAVTLRDGDRTAIIVNPTLSDATQAAVLMHEWAHVELRHRPNRVDRSAGGLLLLSDYPPDLEEEADWFAGALLLPREGLEHHCAGGMTAKSIAAHYGVTEELADWRIAETGVEHQRRG